MRRDDDEEEGDYDDYDEEEGDYDDYDGMTTTRRKAITTTITTRKKSPVTTNSSYEKLQLCTLARRRGFLRVSVDS